MVGRVTRALTTPRVFRSESHDFSEFVWLYSVSDRHVGDGLQDPEDVGLFSISESGRKSKETDFGEGNVFVFSRARYRTRTISRSGPKPKSYGHR